MLILPVPVLGEVVAESKKEKRQAAILPLASYAGLTVSVPVFLASVAAYGIYSVINNRTRATTDNHSCAGNRGWCRSSCFSHEREDVFHSAVCGDYKCCRPRTG
uniref:Big defensin n=1 Tax=Mytilus coruscus TaxID=42192 RepID=A0A8F6T5Y6_MYTCO|nr:big defensin 2 [Mytilus coruscus]